MKPTKAYNEDFVNTRANAILNEAKGRGYYEGPIPENQKTRNALAEKIVEKAREAREHGAEGEDVIAIMFAADVTAKRPDQFTREPKVLAAVGADMREGKDEQDDNNGSDEEKYKKAITEFTKENLPIPPEIEGEPPVLPIDFTELPSEKIRYLHSAFNACAARVGYLLAIEEAGEKAAKSIANNIFHEWLVKAEKKDDQTGRPKTKEVLIAEAIQENEKLKLWRERQNQHDIKAGKLKRLHEHYDDCATRLNEEAIIRQMERTH